MSKKKSQNLNIRNSTAEFLIFTQQAGENGIEVRYENETIWLTQKLIAELFGTSTDNVSLHLKNIYSDAELVEVATTEDFSVVQNKLHYAIHGHTAPELIKNRADSTKQFMGLTTDVGCTFAFRLVNSGV